MKEVTYEDWLKNPTPREMWVWDDYEEDKKKLKVIYFSKEMYPVLTITLDDKQTDHFMHCAEIEKQRRMTNKELSRWLREKPTREYKYLTNDYIYSSDYIYSTFDYREYKQDEEVSDYILIRENDGEWREPLVADHYKED